MIGFEGEKPNKTEVFDFGFVDPTFAALLIPLLTPRAAGNHAALALVRDFHEVLAVPQFELLFQAQLLHQAVQGGR